MLNIVKDGEILFEKDLFEADTIKEAEKFLVSNMLVPVKREVADGCATIYVI